MNTCKRLLSSFSDDACMTFHVNECRPGCEATGLVLQPVKVIPVRCFSIVAHLIVPRRSVNSVNSVSYAVLIFGSVFLVLSLRR